MTYLLWRHLAAALLLIAIMPRTLRQVRRRDWLYGAVLGLFLFVAFATQTIGLQWTTPGKSGFITSLDIVHGAVPLLAGGAPLSGLGPGGRRRPGHRRPRLPEPARRPEHGQGRPAHSRLRPGLRRTDHRHRLLRAAHQARRPRAHADRRRGRAVRRRHALHGARERRLRLEGLGRDRLDGRYRHGLRLPHPGVGAALDELHPRRRDPRPRGPLRRHLRSRLRLRRAHRPLRPRRGPASSPASSSSSWRRRGPASRTRRTCCRARTEAA